MSCVPLRVFVYSSSLVGVLYATPHVSQSLNTELRELDEIRAKLGDATSVPGPWLGQLRRTVRASAVESSVSIEGFVVGPGEAAALAAGDESPAPDDENRMAIASYARAMDHAGVMAIDPHFRWLDRVILDLHFDACRFSATNSPACGARGRST